MASAGNTPGRPLIVVEDDPFLRLMPVILDPDAPAAMMAAFVDFMAHDEPDFIGWCARLRAAVPELWPAEVRLVGTHDELLAALPRADIAMVESLPFGAEEVAAIAYARVMDGPRARDTITTRAITH